MKHSKKFLSNNVKPETEALLSPFKEETSGSLNGPSAHVRSGNNGQQSAQKNKDEPHVKKFGKRFSELEQATLHVHNVYRSVHLVEPLVLDHKLSTEAKQKAALIADGASPKKRTLSNRNEEGENVAMTCKNDGEMMTGPDATSLWYNEICSNNNAFQSNQLQDSSLEFDQVIWKDTQRIGVGRSTFEKDGRFCSVIVARYNPPIQKNSARNNILKGSFDRHSYCNGLGALIDMADGEGYKRSTRVSTDLSENTKDLRQEALNLQNQFRALHESPSMDLDESLCMEAELYATKLAKASSTAVRSSLEDEGENVVKSCNDNMEEMSADEAVRKWYSEVCNPGYSFIGEEKRSGSASFTQMVWKNSNLFGIGKATSEEDGMLCTYIVGRYRNKGNTPGLFKDNVLKGAFDLTYCDTVGKFNRNKKSHQDLNGERRFLANQNIQPDIETLPRNNTFLPSSVKIFNAKNNTQKKLTNRVNLFTKQQRNIRYINNSQLKANISVVNQKSVNQFTNSPTILKKTEKSRRHL